MKTMMKNRSSCLLPSLVFLLLQLLLLLLLLPPSSSSSSSRLGGMRRVQQDNDLSLNFSITDDELLEILANAKYRQGTTPGMVREGTYIIALSNVTGNNNVTETIDRLVNETRHFVKEVEAIVKVGHILQYAF
jgi:hypothetical protein